MNQPSVGSVISISLENCRNISKGEILIEKNKVNIKYGINGVGKTTVSLSIKSLEDDSNTNERLIPFGQSDKKPAVISSEKIESVMCFDEKYINEYLFKESDVLNQDKVYEVLIKTDQLVETEEKLKKMFIDLKSLIDGYSVSDYINKIESLRKSVSLGKKRIITSSPAIKSLKKGNKYITSNIDQVLFKYKELLTGDKNITWIDWFNKGHDFSDNCPYCTASLPDNFDNIKDLIKNDYNKTDVRNATNFLNNLDKNLSFSKEDKRKKFKESFEKNTDDLINNSEYFEYLNKIYAIEFSLTTIKNTKLNDFVDEDKILKTLKDAKKSINDVDFIVDKKLLSSFELIVNKIDLFEKGFKDYSINQSIYRSKLSEKIKTSEKQVNDFMETAGIPYKIQIEHSNVDEPKTLLVHKSQCNVSNIGEGLSYGERNAFALMMFQMDVASSNPDIVILDDPISSFDENKKYAIMHALFKQNHIANLKGKTVIMLTHDFTPIIDFINVKRDSNIKAFYLENKAGVLTEKKIKKNQIKSIVQVSRDLFEDNSRQCLSRIINYRRYLELNNDVNDLKYQMVSSMLKLNTIPKIKEDNNDEIDFTSEQILQTQTQIRETFIDFDYKNMLETFNDKTKIINAYRQAMNYEKIHIIRILELFDQNVAIEETLSKFIKESYHIENTMTFQLDPMGFNTIPEYIITACDAYVNKQDG